MKKRIITLCMAVMLLAVFAVSSFAIMYNDHDLPDIRPHVESSSNLIIQTSSNTVLLAYVDGLTVSSAASSDGDTLLVISPDHGVNRYNLNGDSWEFDRYAGTASNINVSDILWTSINLVYDGVEYMAATSVLYPITPVDPGDMSQISAALTGQINVQHTVSVIALAVTACVGLAFMWWGLRKAIAAIMAAFRKGKINL